MPPSLKSLFLLDPAVIFLNHGSFGACPRPVFEIYQTWQRRLESQPVLFLGREIVQLDRSARSALADFVGAQPDDLVFVPNATHGVNLVARSLRLQPGDEILATDHEYGACEYTWEYICQQTGAVYRRQPVPLPAASPQHVLEALWQGFTPRTRLVYLSHITSSTAQRFPVEAVIQRAHQSGVLTLVDGAHAPGHIPLRLDSLGADFYTGNCHKWLLSPKGAGFLYARPEVQPLLQPLVVSWGYHPAPEYSSGSPFVDLLSWTGTRDPAAALSVPAAIQFQRSHRWSVVRQRCHALLCAALLRIADLTGLPPLYPSAELSSKDMDSPPGLLPPQMGVAELPPQVDLRLLKTRLYDDFRIEIPLIEWNGRKLIRLSIQGYNSSLDIAALLSALKVVLPGVG